MNNVTHTVEKLKKKTKIAEVEVNNSEAEKLYNAAANSPANVCKAKVCSANALKKKSSLLNKEIDELNIKIDNFSNTLKKKLFFMILIFYLMSSHFIILFTF